MKIEKDELDELIINDFNNLGIIERVSTINDNPFEKTGDENDKDKEVVSTINDNQFEKKGDEKEQDKETEYTPLEIDTVGIKIDNKSKFELPRNRARAGRKPAGRRKAGVETKEIQEPRKRGTKRRQSEDRDEPGEARGIRMKSQRLDQWIRVKRSMKEDKSDTPRKEKDDMTDMRREKTKNQSIERWIRKEERKENGPEEEQEIRNGKNQNPGISVGTAARGMISPTGSQKPKLKGKVRDIRQWAIVNHSQRKLRPVEGDPGTKPRDGQRSLQLTTALRFTTIEKEQRSET